MRDASVTVPAAPSVIDGLTAPKGLETMEACCDVSQMLESSHAWQCDSNQNKHVAEIESVEDMLFIKIILMIEIVPVRAIVRAFNIAV